MTLHLHFAAASDTGQVRKVNQDAGYASERMLVVADGMGGAAAGDLASAVALTYLRDADLPETSGEQMTAALTRACEEANEAITDLVELNPEFDGMGTTVCGAMFDGSQLGIYHLGDSRGYLLRDGTLKRLTKDHSWVQLLIDDGKITEDEAATHPHRSLVMKVLNGYPDLDADTQLFEVAESDRVLFCSDGLSGMIDDETIAEGMAMDNLGEAVAFLIDSANAAGGVDNITATLGHISSEAPSSTAPISVGSVTEVDLDGVGLTEVTATDLPVVAAEPAPSGDDRYLPRPPRRRLWRGLLVGALVVGLAVFAGFGGLSFVRSQHYIGEDDGSVAIFRGLPDDLGPLKLGELTETTDVPLVDLPPYYQEEVRTFSYSGLTADEARSTVEELRTASRQCVADRRARARETEMPEPTPTPQVGPTTSVAPSPSPAAPPSAASTDEPLPREC